MGSSRQKYWNGLSFPPPEDLPNPGIELMSLTSPVLAVRFFTTSAIWKKTMGQLKYHTLLNGMQNGTITLGTARGIFLYNVKYILATQYMTQ